MSSGEQDARFTSGSMESGSPIEGICLFSLATVASTLTNSVVSTLENSVVVNDEERNIVLDYSRITNSLPAEEVLCLKEVQREEAEVGDTDSVASHEDRKELILGAKEAIQDQLIQLVKGEDIEECVNDNLDNWILKKGIGEL